MARNKSGNGAVEALAQFLNHFEELYGDGILLGVSQTDFTEELLIYLWTRGYKVTPLEQEDYNDH